MRKRLLLYICSLSLLVASMSIFGMYQYGLPETKEVVVDKQLREDIKNFLDEEKIKAFVRTFENFDQAKSYSHIFFDNHSFMFNFLCGKINRVFPWIGRHKNVIKNLFNEYVKYKIAQWNRTVNENLQNYYNNPSSYPDQGIQNKDWFKDRSKSVEKQGPMSKLWWCICPDATLENRFYLILHLLDNIISKNVDTNKKLGLVSFGAGSLLMEYLIVISLFRLGFKNITVYAIDRGYDARAVSRSFARRALRAFRELFSFIPGVKIKSYVNRYDFLTYWNRDKREKWKERTTIIQLIDPQPGGGRHDVRDINFAEYFTICVKTIVQQNIDSTYVKLSEEENCYPLILPFDGKSPRIFYKEGEMSNETKNFLLSYVEKIRYRGYKDRKIFVDELKKILEKEVASITWNKPYMIIKEVKFDHKLGDMMDKQFEEVIMNVALKNSFIYRLYKKNKIITGGDKVVTLSGKISEPLKTKIQKFIEAGYRELKPEFPKVPESYLYPIYVPVRN